MKCLVTGASSGIGKDICKYLSVLSHEVIMVSSNKEKLVEACTEVGSNTYYVCDLTKDKEVDKLLKFIEKEKPDVIINNAGFGAFGYFDEVETEKEIEMINLNIIALHKITKVALKYMEKQNYGYILNVASSAGLMPGGPILSTYYATKSYVRSYTLSIYEELKSKNSNVVVSVLAPGPVDTNFNKVAGGSFSVKPLSSEYVAKCAIDNLFKKKMIIIPGLIMKLGVFFSRFTPTKLLLNIALKIQHKKRTKSS